MRFLPWSGPVSYTHLDVYKRQGVDLAKQVFSICEVEGAGRVLRRQDFRRDAFSAWLAQVPAGSVVAMEACSGAHHLSLIHI